MGEDRDVKAGRLAGAALACRFHDQIHSSVGTGDDDLLEAIDIRHIDRVSFGMDIFNQLSDLRFSESDDGGEAIAMLAELRHLLCALFPPNGCSIGEGQNTSYNCRAKGAGTGHALATASGFTPFRHEFPRHRYAADEQGQLYRDRRLERFRRIELLDIDAETFAGPIECLLDRGRMGQSS